MGMCHTGGPQTWWVPFEATPKKAPSKKHGAKFNQKQDPRFPTICAERLSYFESADYKKSELAYNQASGT